MKTLRESAIFNGSRFKERTSIVGSYTPFTKDIFEMFTMNPHMEMQKCVEAYNTNPIFQSAVNTIKDFIKGGGIWAKSDNETTEKIVQAYIDSIDMNDWIDEIIENTIKTGNGFLEMDFHPSTKLPTKFYPITDSSVMYVNCDMYGKPKKVLRPVSKKGEIVQEEVENLSEYYIQKIPHTTRHPKAKWYDMSYNIGSRLSMFRVYGIPIHKDKIAHFKLNSGDLGIYGRAWIAAALNDNEILKQVEQSIAIIAKHKAVPRKIIQYGDKDLPAGSEETDNFIQYLESLNKEDDVIVNKPIKMEAFAYAGGEINLDYIIQHIKKKLIGGQVPDFMVGFGQDVNRATAQVELLSWVLAIYTKRRIFLKTLEKRILEPWLRANGIYQKVWLEFGELELETKSEKTNRVLQLWSSNLLTLQQTLKMLNISFDGEDESLKSKRAFELQESMMLGGEQPMLPDVGQEPVTGENPVLNDATKGASNYLPSQSSTGDRLSAGTHHFHEDLTTANGSALLNTKLPNNRKVKEYPEGYSLESEELFDDLEE